MQTTVGTGVRFPPLKLKYRYVRFELMEVKKIGIQLFTEFPIFVNPLFSSPAFNVFSFWR